MQRPQFGTAVTRIQILVTAVPNSIRVMARVRVRVRVRVEFVTQMWTYTALLNMVIEFGIAVTRFATILATGGLGTSKIQSTKLRKSELATMQSVK